MRRGSPARGADGDLRRAGGRPPHGRGSFDAAQSLALLRAEEWPIASALHRYQRLRAEHRDEPAAASDRVRTLLARQDARQEAAFTELSTQVRPIMEYGTTIREALRAHAEWEQIDRALAAGRSLAAEPDERG